MALVGALSDNATREHAEGIGHVQPLRSGFRLERDMARSAERWLVDQGLITKSEFQVPWGICDFVGVSLNDVHVQQRLYLGQHRAIGPLLRVDILRRVPDINTGRCITINRLERFYGEFLTPGELGTQIGYLIKHKFVMAEKHGRIQRLNGWEPLHNRIVALELKLTRVQDVLRQAMLHLAFAEESFVGLPATLAQRVATSNRAREFRRLGVGIVSIGADKCDVLLPSKPSRAVADPVLRMHSVERFWRTRPRDN